MKDEGPEDLRKRTKRFALGIVQLFATLPKTTLHQVLGKQLLRAGTSVGAQYAEAFRSRSTAESISKIESAVQEIEETKYWLELLGESASVSQSSLQPLLDESEELTAILVTCAKKLKARKASSFILHSSSLSK